MATEKQCGLLAHLAKKLDVPKKWDEWKEMEGKAASKLIDEMQEMSKEIKQSSKTEINGIRFGLAAKLVIQSKTPHLAVLWEESTIEEIFTVYKLMEKAEKAFS